MKLLVTASLILAELISADFISAQQGYAIISLERNEIKLGEQIKATVEISFPVNTEYNFAGFTDTLTSKIEIVNAGPVESTFGGDNLSLKILKQNLIITSFDTGFHTIPPMVFYGRGDSIKTEPYLLTVRDVKTDIPDQTQGEQAEVEIKDIKDIRAGRFSLWEWIKENYLMILLVLLLTAAVWVYIKYIHPRIKEKGLSVIVPEKIIPPHEIALNKLSQLEGKKLWQQNKAKLYHSELSEIIREYIENQMQIPALEFTSLEIITSLSSHKLDENLRNEFKQMLLTGDLVKFAKYQPMATENEICMSTARKFILDTKPKEKIESTEVKTHV